MAPRELEEDAGDSLREPLLPSDENSTESLLNANNNNNDEINENTNEDDDKNITLSLPSSCCPCFPSNTFRMNHNVFLNLVLASTYGISDSLWGGTVLAAYLKKIGHGRNSWVGNIEASNGLASLFSALPVGYLADHWGRDRVLRLGGILLIGTAIAHASLMEWIGTNVNDDAAIQHRRSSSHTELYLAAIMALWGIGNGIVMGPSQALFADSTPQGKRSEYYMYLFISFALSSSLGPLVSIVLFQSLGDDWDLYDLRIIIFVGLALDAFNGFLMMFFDDRKALDESPHHLEEQEQLLLQGQSNDNSQKEEEEETQSLPASKTSTTTPTPSTTTIAQDEEDGTTQATDNDTIQNNIFSTTLRQKYKGWIPYILFLQSLIFALGSGMTVKFFPLFFKDQVGMSPTQVQIVYFIVPLGLAAFSGIGQTISTKFGLGRVPTAALFKLSGVSLLFCMVFFKDFLDNRPLLLVPIYILRTALMNASYPLEESILMDNVSKQERGRWKSLESIASFGWCGSAAIGGWISDHGHDGDYTFTFLITACIQTVGALVWCLLWPLVVKEGGEEHQEAAEEATTTTTTTMQEQQDELSLMTTLENSVLNEEASVVEQ